MTQEIKRKIKLIAARYADCGISEARIMEMMRDRDKPSGLDDRAKIIGIRMCLGMEFNRQEYFTLDDVAHVTGESEAAAMKRMQDVGAKPVFISPAPWLTGGAQ